MEKKPENKQNDSHPGRTFFYLFIMLLLIWLALTSSFHPQELAVGVVISLVLSLLLYKTYQRLGLPPITPARIAYFFIYLGVLFKEVIKANFDVAYRVIHPRMPIKPGVVVVKTNLKADLAKMVLANSITLTPGTFTLDIVGDNLLIHWINVRTDDADAATRIIGERFEKYLIKIFQ